MVLPDTSISELTLSIGVALVAFGLIGWQRAERARRDPLLSIEDEAHFLRQDRRRWLVAGIMFILSTAILAGSRMPPRLAEGPNYRFVQVWLLVFLLAFLLIMIALVDWVSTRAYARRHRTAIVQEGFEILRDEIKTRRLSASNGQAINDTDATPS